jgi:DNA-binding phage protein
MARDLQQSAMARRKVRTTRYDSAALLETPRDIAAYLGAAMEMAIRASSPPSTILRAPKA